MKCEVCLEAFTKELRRKIECPFCEYSACSQCHQRYLLGSSEYAHCMSCRKVWNREILFNNFTDKFVNKTYKKWREEILFEREKSFMPETQPYVEIELEVRKVQRQIVKIESKIGKIYKKAQEVGSAPVELFATEGGIFASARIERYRQFCNIRKEAAVLEWDLKYLNHKIAEFRNKKPAESEKRKFIRSCPADDCSGFLSTAWKCGLCKVNVCSKCHEIKSKDDEHICDAANVQTAELLAKDSKTCPTCAALIFKISGCDQIWCTQCHTAFNWRTQQVEKGVIHNPHYYDYMRQHGRLQRADGDVPCGGVPDYYSITTRVHKITYSKEQLEFITSTHRWINHWYFADQRYRLTTPEDLRKYRIQYMVKDITKEDYQKRLQQLEKMDNKHSEIRDVIGLFRTIGTEIIQKIAAEPEVNYAAELSGLREHCNELLQGVKRRWKCSISDVQF